MICYKLVSCELDSIVSIVQFCLWTIKSVVYQLVTAHLWKEKPFKRNSFLVARYLSSCYSCYCFDWSRSTIEQNKIIQTTNEWEMHHLIDTFSQGTSFSFNEIHKLYTLYNGIRIAYSHVLVSLTVHISFVKRFLFLLKLLLLFWN